MAFPGGNLLSLDLDPKTFIVGFSLVAITILISGLSRVFLLFFYACFVKPHSGKDNGTQQDALESFYKKQAGIYDKTREILLQGREDMLALSASELLAREKMRKNNTIGKPIWVDVGGGTGWNIEAMSAFLDVPRFFSSVYLVDLSPSLCEIAQQRFQRLGWDNVKVVCEDARKFTIENYEGGISNRGISTYYPVSNHVPRRQNAHGIADLITMSYSLSMIPDYFSVVDSLNSLLSPDGVMGVIDFYVQSKTEFSFRNYTGGIIGRHVGWFMRAFWRAWFDLDRVNLEASRRDYLEYRFGTIKSVSARNNYLGRIPYYVWVGCRKDSVSSKFLPYEVVEKIDALATESHYSDPADLNDSSARTGKFYAQSKQSGASITAIQNLSNNLPLPAFFYQNHHWRIYYDESLRKHTQFKDDYIYTFTWEDSQADDQLLKLTSDDVVLAITSAGDNILSYALRSPAKIHAVDLNPSQNHLLELKMASYTALSYEDFWMLFGEGKHPNFRNLLLTNLSPHLSSRAFQFWLDRCHIFSTSSRYGLYDTGGSRHGIRAFRWISYLFGFHGAVQKFLKAKALDEQRHIWQQRIRPALLSNLVCRLIVSQERFLWSALGVPKHQLTMIENDYVESLPSGGPTKADCKTRSRAIWRYMVSTLDPVVENTQISLNNPYYHICMAGTFSRQCHPEYLSREAHANLSQPDALDGIQIHTDEIDEVLSHMDSNRLTVAVLMDSMDWFDSNGVAAAAQITKLNRTLKMGGRVLLRSSALRPWYVDIFEAHGFSCKCTGSRTDGACIDRVNMYASCWLCTKMENLPLSTPEPEMTCMDVSDNNCLSP
ncbi:3-amino-3-carboxypropyl transferase [Penicillium brevicompactum]|uniref:3-amino-3-carboxypropyl transferase n=1 Tax=Penicillium brevicompactum TaxID=5074 RepID=UPI002540E87A|nr:3-amino-3-carboxypropyl transferase [Penicillium brevicompactum]KAJ5332964.1 3-amino-3-carboxypropyl transferase [Penicillium brevicompactum]